MGEVSRVTCSKDRTRYTRAIPAGHVATDWSNTCHSWCTWSGTVWRSWSQAGTPSACYRGWNPETEAGLSAEIEDEVVDVLVEIEVDGPCSNGEIEVGLLFALEEREVA